LQLLPHMWRTLGVAAAVTETLARLRPGQRSGRRLEENLAPVVDAHGVEDAFVREALGGGVMHAELGGHLGYGEPSRPAEMFSQTRNPVRAADVPDEQAAEGLAGARPKPALVEGRGHLPVGLLRREGADLLDDGRGSPPQVRCPQGERPLEGCRRPTLPANLELDRAVSPEEGDILDEQAQHALALPGRGPRILPHS